MSTKKHIIIEILLFPLKLLWIVIEAGFFAGFLLGVWFILQMYGVFSLSVPVSGASMLPTLPEEGNISFQRYVSDSRVHRFLPQPIERGDIVVFENDKTKVELRRQHKDGSGFVKRVVGVPGDKISIRDGFVYVNGTPQQEKYTLKARSTFGGDAVRDCQEVLVPENKLFVLGDNRKVSYDSRQLGLIQFDDIQYYIPFSKQPDRFASVWRDPTHDLDSEFKSLFDVKEYLRLLNQERARHQLDPLKYEPKLEKSARLRAQKMLEYDDFSYEAIKSGYTMQDAMKSVGYSNIISGEFPMTGYYDARELFDAFLEQPQSSKFLLNADYDDIGVSTFVGELAGCPIQVVVQHLAGYVPPNYKAADIASWATGLEQLKTVQPGWDKLKTYEEFYKQHQTEIDRINVIIAQRITHYEQIVKRMRANEWLSQDEKQWITEDRALADEQSKLAVKLNNPDQ